MLPTPCGWLLFSSAFVQRLTLANQLNQIFQAETNIDTPFQCIWGNIYGIGDFKKTTAPAIQIKCHPSHKIAIQTLLLSLISPSAIDNQDPRYIFQRRMVFLSPDMLTITDADYASMICDQFNFQASEATLKVTGLCSLSTIITGSTNTLGTALSDLPDPTVCNYLFRSIETTTASFHPAYLLCFSRQFTSYTTNLITSLFPTLALLYPTLQITDVWETPSNHPTKETITEVLAKSNLHLQAVKSFNPYDASHIRPTPIPDSDLPQRKTKSRKHPGHNNPPPRPTASISPQLPSSWSQGPPTQHNNQPTVSSLSTTGTAATDTTTQMLNNLQAQVAAISLRLNPAPIPSQEVNIQEITAQLNQSIANLPALIQQHIQATLHSPDFSAAVTQTIRSEILSLQPPYSQSEESGSEDE